MKKTYVSYGASKAYVLQTKMLIKQISLDLDSYCKFMFLAYLSGK